MSSVIRTRRFGRLPVATTESGLSRSTLYVLATKHEGLFRKLGSTTLVDLDLLDTIIAGLPPAEINIAPRPSRRS